MEVGRWRAAFAVRGWGSGKYGRRGLSPCLSELRCLALRCGLLRLSCSAVRAFRIEPFVSVEVSWGAEDGGAPKLVS